MCVKVYGKGTIAPEYGCISVLRLLHLRYCIQKISSSYIALKRFKNFGSHIENANRVKF